MVLNIFGGNKAFYNLETCYKTKYDGTTCFHIVCMVFPILPSAQVWKVSMAFHELPKVSMPLLMQLGWGAAGSRVDYEGR